MQRTRVFGGLVLILALFLTTLTGSASAQDDSDQPEFATITLASRRSTAGAVVVPVEVAIASLGRAIDGNLVIEGRDIAVNWELSVQLAASTEARQTILVPVSPFGSVTLDAFLVVDGEEVASSELEVQDPRVGRKNAVGVLGLDLPGATIDLSPDVGEAALYEVTNLELLQGFDSVVVSPSGMRSLSEDEQRQLLNWVSSGHQLVVADSSGSIDGELPAEWQEAGDTTLAGAGLIRYVGDDWQGSLPPGPTVASSPRVSEFSGVSHNELKSDAGFKVPGIGIIASILGAYILLAGPLLFSVLAARNKQRLAWVLLPALAVVFTVGVVVTGSVLTRGRGNGHATIVEVSPIGSSFTDTLLIADSGEQRVQLPVGYSLATTNIGSSGGNAGSPVIVEPTAGADELVFEIDSGSGGTAIVRGESAAFASALTISDVVTSTDEISGAVNNSTGADLLGVVAIVGNRLAEIGEIANGATAQFSIELGGRARQQSPELQAWGIDNQLGGFREFEGPIGFGGDAVIDDGPINGSAWIDWRNTRNGTNTPSGLVTAIGWTRSVNASLLTGQGRTAFVARHDLGTISGALNPDAIRTVPTRASDPFGIEFEFGGFDGGDFGETSQYIRPSGSDTSQVAIQVDNFVTALEVWTGSNWRSFELPEQGRVDVAIPADAWISDVLWVRASAAGGFFDPSVTLLQLVSADDDTESLVLLPEGEFFERRPANGGFEGGGEVVFNEAFDVELDEDNSFEGEGDIFNSYDEWRIVLAEGDEVTVSMNAFNNGGLDPYLIIRDPDGRNIAENDDFNGLNSRVTFGADDEGIYTIETRPLSGGGGGGSYEVLIDVEVADPDAVRPTTTDVPTTLAPEGTTIPEPTTTTVVEG